MLREPPQNGRVIRRQGAVHPPRLEAPTRSIIPITALVLSALLPSGSHLFAPGVTTAAIHGGARAADGADVDGSHVEVLNTATGFIAESEVHHGRFLIHGLEVGGLYTVTVEQLGFPHEAPRARVPEARRAAPGRPRLDD